MGICTEEEVIKKRKQKADFAKLCYKIVWMLCPQRKKVVFTTFEGDGGFCCNPRYIAEELLDRKMNIEIVWLVNNIERKFPEGIKKVRNTFLNRLYQLATASVWVDNSRKPYGTRKRKSQLYIQTWHATLGFKATGKLRGKQFPRIAYIVSDYDSKLIDYVTMNSKWCRDLYPDILLYNGKMIKSGSPRCDVFFDKKKEIYQKIRREYGIEKNTKIVMFAPTFRGGNQRGKRQIFAEIPTLDFEMLMNALESRFGGKWCVFLRLHPQLSAQMKEMPIENRKEYMIDVSQSEDMNELLAASDVLITDYSSSAFDVLHLFMPVFLYADDLENYVGERGGLLWDMESLPFSLAQNNKALARNIQQFNEEKYVKKIREFINKHEILEDGKASQRIADIIERFLNNDDG